MNNGDEYEEIRRRKAEERRKIRDAERLKRRNKWGGGSSKPKPKAKAGTSSAKASITTPLTREATVVTRNTTNKAAAEALPLSSSYSSLSRKKRHRNRADPDRIQQLKEQKRTEEGLRLIQEMYGTNALVRADDDMGKGKRSGILHSRTCTGTSTMASSASGGFGMNRTRPLACDSPYKSYTRNDGSSGTTQDAGSPLSNYRYRSQSRKSGDPTNSNVYEDVDSFSNRREGGWKSTTMSTSSRNAHRTKSPSSNKSPSRSNNVSTKLPSPKPHAPSFTSTIWQNNNHNNDDSSSDEDLVALAKKLEEKKRKSPKERSRSMSTSSNGTHRLFVSKSLHTTAGSNQYVVAEDGDASVVADDDDDDDDLIKSAKKIQASRDFISRNDLREDNNDGGGGGPDNHDGEESEYDDSKHHKEKISKLHSKESDEEEEVEVDLMAYSRKLHKIQKRKRQEVDSESDQEFLEESEEKEKYMVAEHSNKKSETKLPSTTGTVQVRDFPEVDLWDDAEDEMMRAKFSMSRIKRKSKRGPKKINKAATEGNEDICSMSEIEEDGNEDSATKKVGMKQTQKNAPKRHGRKIVHESEKAPHQLSFSDLESDSSVDDLKDDSLLDKKLRPTFENPKWLGNFVPFALSRGDGSGKIDHIPAAINRYLKDYQQEGVQFLHSVVSRGLGAVLGDDMGLGKTIQLISLVAALQGKTGTKKDLKVITDRHRMIEENIKKQRASKDLALLVGSTVENKVLTVSPRPWSPVLIIVPPSVITNWENEFKRWGYFSVASYRGADKAQVLNRMLIGMHDVLLCGKSMLNQNNFVPLLDVSWKLIVIDEFHEYKNRNTNAFKCLEELRNASVCPLIGLTGTIMSNHHKELHTLIDLVQPGLLGDYKEFNTEFSRPIMLSRTKDAKADVIKLGTSRNEQLKEILSHVYLRRDKSVALEGELPTKDQKVMFCKLSNVQKALYQHILRLPEYDLLMKSASPCDCGVNKAFFMQYRSLPTKAQKLEYYRRHKGDIVQRKQCCYQVATGDRIALWPAQHSNGEPCSQCPTCILLPALNKLYKICSHASLLQVDCHPDLVENEREKIMAEKNLAFAKIAIPDDVLTLLPGQSYIRGASILDDHSALSGKMKTLSFFLRKYERKRDRVLVFSYSTATLDLIQQFVKERGYSHLRLDGSTPVVKRQGLIDMFQQNDDIFLFLISTKAGGMGLNLTAANRVIIYDVNWNPSHDEQAQDRSYRIGQERDVDVVRLVSSGTIEERMYMRQVYKVHLKQQTLISDDYSAVQPARIFRGVDKDKNRKGELFGIENLLDFKDDCFLNSMWKAADGAPQSSNGLIQVADISNALKNASAEQIADVLGGSDNDLNSYSDQDLKGFNHDDFMREDKGNAAILPGDEGFEEEMGIGSQMVDMACDKAVDIDPDNVNIRMPRYPELGIEGTIDTTSSNSLVKKETPSIATNRSVDIFGEANVKKEPTKFSNNLNKMILDGRTLPNKTEEVDEESEHIIPDPAYFTGSSTQDALFASVTETLTSLHSKGTNGVDSITERISTPISTPTLVNKNSFRIDKANSKPRSKNVPKNSTMNQLDKQMNTEKSNEKSNAGDSSTIHGNETSKPTFKARGQKGNKNGIPTFSSRQMLYIPSYLRGGGEKK